MQFNQYVHLLPKIYVFLFLSSMGYSLVSKKSFFFFFKIFVQSLKQIFKIWVNSAVVHSVIFTQSYPTLRNLMDCSTPGLPVPCHLPEFAQFHVHCISESILTFHKKAKINKMLIRVGLPIPSHIFKYIIPTRDSA